MIAAQLKGRLGNQMFQFAAAFAASQRLGTGTIFSGTTASRRLGVLGTTLLKSDHLENIKMNGLLRQAFGIGPTLITGRALEISKPLIKYFIRNEYAPPRLSLDSGFTYEKFDTGFFDIPDQTWLNGWLQSEKYFDGFFDKIDKLFSPIRSHSRALDKAKRQLGIGGKPTVGLHVRRGDYLRVRNQISDPATGWALGRDYFSSAVEAIGSGYNYVIFSDDPDWAGEAFRHLNPCISRNRHPVVDLFGLSECEKIVISNSSFSWWAGWLGHRRGNMVYAPKYHLGWRQKIWIPEGIQTGGFHYLDVPGPAPES